MKKVTTINLNGNAYQIEETGYETLRAYLESAETHLKDNPDKKEIIKDIEQALSEKCQALLSSYKTVITSEEIEALVKEMGPVDGAPSTDAETKKEEPKKGPRRLYEIKEGSIISGVCNGLAVYFNIDVVLVRIAFVLLTFLTHGGFILVYVVLMIALPSAQTPEEVGATYGPHFKAQDFVDQAKKKYQDFSDKEYKKKDKWQYKREWKREMRMNRRMRYGSPFLRLAHVLLSVAWIYSIVTLFTDGTIFGTHIPANMPSWVAFILLMIAYNFIAWPLRAQRYSAVHGMHHGDMYQSGWMETIDGFAWLGFMILIGYAVYLWIPPAHNWMQHAYDVSVAWLNSK